MRIKLQTASQNPLTPGVRVPLGDVYPLARAYGWMDKLRSAYVGKWIRVRRSSDNTAADIGFVGYDADLAGLLSFVGAGDGFLETWFDQSPVGCHLTQTTAAAQPKIVSGGVLNWGVLFDGVDDILSSLTVGLYAAGAASVFAVLSGAAWAAGLGSATGTIFGESNAAAANGRYFPLNRSGSSVASQGASYVINDAATTVGQVTKASIFDGTAHQVTFLDDGTHITLRGDGASGAPVTYARSGSLTPTRTVMGGRMHSSGGINPFAGSVRELVALASMATTEQVTVVEASQRSRLIPA